MLREFFGWPRQVNPAEVKKQDENPAGSENPDAANLSIFDEVKKILAEGKLASSKETNEAVDDQNFKEQIQTLFIYLKAKQPDTIKLIQPALMLQHRIDDTNLRTEFFEQISKFFFTPQSDIEQCNTIITKLVNISKEILDKATTEK